MKKYSNLIFVALVLMGIICSCKKNSTAKDYGTSIKDKTWWGTFTFTGQTPQHYTVHFKADNSLVWSQESGDYEGQWTINGNKLKIAYTSNVITADISDDGKLTNLEDNYSTYVINNAELIANPNIPLDNSVWVGAFDYGSSLLPLELSFMPGNQIKLKSAVLGGTFTYSRSGSGAGIRFTNAGVLFFFGVIISGSKMRGNYAYPWEATKQ